MAGVLVAGAGIGGLAAALALARVGIDVTVLESARRFDGIGAGVQLSPNATRILARLGVLDTLSHRALRPDGIRIRDGRSGRLIAALDLTGAEARWGGPYLVAHRSDLHEALREAVAREPAITLHLDTRLCGFGTPATSIQVAAKQAGISRTFEGDALIGADGIRSTVRARLVDGDDPPRETGRTAWRALIPADAVAPIFRSRDTGLWLGPDAHLVHYPLNDGSRINVVAITREPSAAAPDDLWAAPGDPATIGRRFARWDATAQALIAAAPAWTTWPLFDRTPLGAWNSGRIALLGDAAHPILPFLAQGGAQAIEDAAALAEAFAATRDIPDALARYSAARRDRARRVQTASRTLGRLYHLGGPAALARNAGMRLLGGDRLLARYDWLYGLRPRET